MQVYIHYVIYLIKLLTFQTLFKNLFQTKNKFQIFNF